ncbi:MAG: hypothetical protein K6C33_01625 [Desulfovibrio sp.]|nr:hypothetical protein [Desulfovibrio sp.]
MNLERFALRRRLVDYLCQARPALVERLKATRQLAPGGATPYHMEDGVWTHVMLVLQAALERDDFSLADMLCALVHDFGKPDTARLRTGAGGLPRISFYDHGPRGVQEALDFLLDCQKAFSVSDAEICDICFCVSKHIDFYSLDGCRQAGFFCNGRRSLLAMMARLFYCDVSGSVMDPSTEAFKDDLALLLDVQAKIAEIPLTFPDRMPKPPLLRFVCGAPGPAMDAYLASLACPVVRETEVRRELFERRFGRKGVPLPQRYAGIYEATRPLDAAPLLLSRIRDFEGEPEIAVAGILATRRARAGLASFLSMHLTKTAFACTFVLTPTAGQEAFLAGEAGARLAKAHDFQHLPCLFHEPAFAQADVVLSRAPQGVEIAG